MTALSSSAQQLGSLEMSNHHLLQTEFGILSGFVDSDTNITTPAVILSPSCWSGIQ